MLAIATLLLAVQATPIDSIFAFYTRETPGCAVSVVDGARVVVSKGYGMASLEHDLPITPQSAFYAASVSKQFTAFAVALLAQQGKLSLDDDIRKWIPEVPDFGKTITIRHLIHHTSGLRDYFGLLGMTGWPNDAPLTEMQFLELVGRQKALNFEPGTRHLYSNTGYVLLSILVKRVSGQSLREFADAAMFKPLGMTNTMFRDDHTMLVKNRALAYSSPRAGQWRLNTPSFDVVGDGGLYTTVEDLTKWARNFDGFTVGGATLGSQILTRGRLNSGDSLTYAFGLTHNVFRGARTIEHGGAYGGYRTHFMHFPEQQFSIAILCNAGNAFPAGFAQRVARVLLGDRLGNVAAPAGPPIMEPRVSVSKDELAQYAGAYWSGKSELLRRFELRDTLLTVDGTTQALVPLGNNRFANTGRNVLFVFTRSGNTMQLEETPPNGEKVVYQRVSPARTDAATLATYTGDYYSDELGYTWRLEPREGKLVIRRRGLPDIPLEPAFLHAFMSPAGVLRFERSAAGRVTGFVVGQGRVTGFTFQRVK